MIALPGRQRVLTWSTPDVYTKNSGPILDLFPVQGRPPLFDEMWFHQLPCAYQMNHGQAIAANSVHTSPEGLPQVKLGQLTTQACLQGRAEDAKTALSALGFKTVVFHADYFLPEDRAKIDEALGSFGSARALSTNAGIRVIAQSVPVSASTMTDEERTRHYEALVFPTHSDLEGKPLVDTLHASPNAAHNSDNGKVALAGTMLYALIAAGWFLQRRLSTREGSTP